MTDRVEAIPTGAHWGVYDVLVEDGRIVGSRPWEEDPDPAPLHARRCRRWSIIRSG